MEKLRHIGDGLLVAVGKKPPTEIPEGYERDEFNPHLFRIILPECAHRSIVEVPKPKCKCLIKRMKCDLDSEIKTRQECGECKKFG
jgi:hypothetical protein